MARSPKKAMDRGRLGMWAGMIGPLLFVATFTLEGWFRPGYAPLRMYVSELSLGPRGWIQCANFVVLGGLLLAFAGGVWRELPRGRASRAGPILLALIAIGFLLSGFFVMDPAATPRAEMSVHGFLHGLFGALVFSLSPVSAIVFLSRFRADPKWRAFGAWTLLAAIVIVAAVVLLRVGPTRPPAAPNAFNGWVGLIQRTALVTYLFWLFTFAASLRARGTRESPAKGD